MTTPFVSVVVPTYREAASLPTLVERIAAVKRQLPLELIIVDDDSRDGTQELVNQLDLPWVRLIIRTADRGLSQAVLVGLNAARGETLVVMDADLSHPPEAIEGMVAALDAGADFVLASRYAEGGSTADAWGILRWVNSKLATLLARPLTAVSDPMSGFFALRRQTVEQAQRLRPLGYKIGLELMVRCGCQRVLEVPIHFSTRKHGQSKLTLRQQLLYVRHLRRLYSFCLRSRFAARAKRRPRSIGPAGPRP